MTARPLLRFMVWLCDSLPIYSWRRCCAEWENGREFGVRSVGITRDRKGRFSKISR